VGRKLNAKTRVFEALKEPVEVDSATHAGTVLMKVCRFHYDLWPADADTARLCGRPFVELVQGPDNEWLPKDRTIDPVTGHPKKNRQGQTFERDDDGKWRPVGASIPSASTHRKGKSASAGAEE
jgi:hypothetical protein